MSNYHLPDGWTLVKLGDVVDQVKDRVTSGAAAPDVYVPGGSINRQSYGVSQWLSVDDGLMGPAFHMIAQPGDVLYKSRVPHGVAVADRTGICANTTYVLRTRDGDVLLQEFIPHVLSTSRFLEHESLNDKGSTNLYLNFSDVAKYEFALPPLGEQQQICGILDAIDAVVSSLEGALISCRLLGTAEISRVLADESYPRGCVADIVVQDSQGVQVGPFGGSLSSRHFRETGTPVLKIQNLSPGGEIDSSNLVYVANDYADSLSRYKVAAGDVVTAAQATIGRSALVGADTVGALISQHLIRVRPDPNLFFPDLLCRLFNSDYVLRQMARVKTKTTRDGLNTADVKAFEIPLVPLADQFALTARLDQLRAVERGLAAHLSAALACRRGLLTALLCGGER